MTSNATQNRAPIGALRMSTIAVTGVIVAVGVSAVAAAIVLSTQVSDQQALVKIDAAGPISRVVITDSESDVRITGDAAANGVTGQAAVQWKGEDGKRPVLRQSVSGGVLTLIKDCSGGGCGPIDIVVSVPRGVSVQATTSDGNITLSGVTGQVDLTSSGGSINADGLGAANASFHTLNGNIDASFTGAPARIVAETTNASVTIGTDGRTAYYDAVHTTNGVESLTNVQDRTSPDEIDATTTNGDVTIS